MQDFEYHNPTRIVFGKGALDRIAALVPRDQKVLVTYGGGSIKRNGVWDRVVASLADHRYVTFGGIPPNPTYEVLTEAIALGKREGVAFVLAVGGGSVIDGSKFIAAGIAMEADAWGLMTRETRFVGAIPIGAVLTLPAAGSESNFGMVVSRGQKKLPFMHPDLQPRFAVMDPTTTYTLPPRQTANGVVDAYVHVMEQYLTYPADGDVQDRYAESLLKVLIERGPQALADPENYDHRANLMWAATQALNGLIGMGVPQDWSTHMIGHELTAHYGLDHAQTLAIVLPAMMDRMREPKRDKLVRYAAEVWGFTGDADQAVAHAIAQTRTFFESLGVPTTLGAYDIGEGAVDTVVSALEGHGMVRLGERGTVTPEVAREVLRLAL